MVFVSSGPPQRNRRPRAHRACVPFGIVGQRRDAKNPRSCLRAQDDGGEMALPRTVRAKHERSPVWSNKSSLADRNSERLAAFALACIAQVSAARSRVTAAPAIERRFGADNVEKSMRQQLSRFGLAAGLLAGTTCIALAQGSSSPSASSGSSTRDCTDQSSSTTGSLGGGSSMSGTSGSAGLGTSGSSSLTGGSGASGTSGSSAGLSGSGSGSSISGSG